MCGIVGILNLNQPKAVPESLLRLMLGMIRHRGPDEFGLYSDEWANLGNARLSIIDLSNGQQPICNEDETLWIVFNGEIFNHVELRSKLERLGHRFRTHCDTEVVLHLYEEYGPDCLNDLNGQFAIAIWDTRQRQLFLARDRLGIRPLFYTVSQGQLIFGSEIKTLLVHPSVSADLDPQSLAQVFTFWGAQVPHTIFKDIYTLPPAHFLIVRDGEFSIHPYWTLDFDSDSDAFRSPQEFLAEFEELLIQSTLIRLRADVPVGAYLSGGLDSSTTTALIRQCTQNPLETFSIAFSDPDFDESKFQHRMAASLGTKHHVVHCTYEDIGEVFPDVIWHAETPILRTAPAPMMLLASLVRDHGLKVVITGEGADEFLGGYDIFKEVAIRQFWARQPDSDWRPLLLQRLYPEIARLGNTNASFLRRFFQKQLTETDMPFYSHLIRWSNGMRLHRLLRCPPDKSALEMAEALLVMPDQFQKWSPLAKAQYLEIVTFLSPYLLCSQGDRVAMANSIEGRFPFLDYRLVEFCNKLPQNLKMRGLNEKWLLRQLAKKLLPSEIWQRRKRPYRAPIHHSFFHAKAPTYVMELLSESALKESGLFNPMAVTQLVRKAQSGTPLSEVDDMAIAGVLSTQLMHHQFIKNFESRLATLTTSDRIKVVRRSISTDFSKEPSS